MLTYRQVLRFKARSYSILFLIITNNSFYFIGGFVLGGIFMMHEWVVMFETNPLNDLVKSCAVLIVSSK